MFFFLFLINSKYYSHKRKVLGDYEQRNENIDVRREVKAFLKEFNLKYYSKSLNSSNHPVKNAVEMKRNLIVNFCKENLVNFIYFQKIDFFCMMFATTFSVQTSSTM